jgi:Zn-dependent protease
MGGPVYFRVVSRNLRSGRRVAEEVSMPPSFKVVHPAVPVRVSRGAAVPIAACSALFTVFGTQIGMPLVLSVVFGGLGGAVSLLFHELGHVRAAANVPSVKPTSVSFIWAGAATTLEGRYRTGREQARVALGGPRASFTFALTLIAVCFLPSPLSVKEPLLLLAMFNIGLALMNLLPAYPLDGYKFVTGLLWSLTGSESKARRILRRAGIGWAMLEVPAAVVLLIEKPALGGIAVSAAAMLVAQKRLLPLLMR